MHKMVNSPPSNATNSPVSERMPQPTIVQPAPAPYPSPTYCTSALTQMPITHTSTANTITTVPNFSQLTSNFSNNLELPPYGYAYTPQPQSTPYLQQTNFTQPQFNTVAAQLTIAQLQEQINSLKISMEHATTASPQVENVTQNYFARSRFAPEAQNEIFEYDPDLPSVTAERFIESVENARTFHGLDDRNTIIHAKMKLRGAARLWNESEPNVTSWYEFKLNFFSTFCTKSHSIDVHRKLRERKQLPDESVKTYVFTMRQIAGSHVDQYSLISYVIQGLNDIYLARQFYTTVPTNTTELLQRADAYTSFENNRKHIVTGGKDTKTVRIQSAEKSNSKPTEQKGSSNQNTAIKSNNYAICPFCMEAEHRMKDCPKVVCCNCNTKGHLTRDCQNKKQPNKTALIIESRAKNKIIPIRINDRDAEAFVDTGSTVNLITLSKINDLGICYIETDQTEVRPICLSGLKNATCYNIGLAKLTITIKGKSVHTRFYVVEDDAIPVPVILGDDFFETPCVVLRVERGIADISINEDPDEADETRDLKINPDIATEQKDKIVSLVQNTTASNSEPVAPPGFEMNIQLTSPEPVMYRPRRFSIAEQKCVEDNIRTLLDKGIIRPSKSDYASPVVLVDKKNGEKRLCIDYRAINKITVKDKFPLPLIDAQIDALSNHTYFTTLDLKNGFFHVPVGEESKKYTAFITHNGLFEYNFMPFGLTNSPATFQRYINKVFEPLLWERIILVYMDDILIMSETIEDGIVRLGHVMEIIRQFRLNLQLEKCQFLQTETEYLGFRIRKNEVRPQLRKTEAVSKFPVPTSVKQVQRFLGLAGYFRRFIPSYSTIARPLSALTKKDQSFKLGSKELEAFEKIKAILCSQPVLGIYSPHRATEVHTDASSFGYGAVLLQKNDDGRMHPIYYMSATTSDAESRYASFELEMLAIYRSLEKFRVYLLGIPFKLVTDCNSLKLALSKREVNSRIFRWSILLADFDYTVEHRSSKSMQHVDALSRVSMMVHRDPDSELRFLKIMQQKDPDTAVIVDELEKGSSPRLKQYDLRNGILCYKHEDRRLFVVPRNMRRNIVCAAHDDNGHVGREKTIQKVLESYWFPKLRRYVAKHIKHCLKCVAFNGASGKPSGRLHSIPKGNSPFLTLHCDHVGPIDPPSAGFKHILVVIDAYSKFVFLNATKTTSSREVIKVMEQIFQTFGPPQVLICDRGSAFTSEEFTDFMTKHRVTRTLTATATPRANGQCERYNRTIGSILAKVTKDNNWTAQLTTVQHVLNNSHQRSIDATPAKLLFGYSLRTNPDQELRDLIQMAIQSPEPQHLDQRQAARDHAEAEQVKAQDDNERRYNLRRRPPGRYVVGDHVLIKSVRPAGKLQPKYQGPYQVTKVLEHDRYVVEDIPGAQVTQRFYSGILPSDRIRLYVSEDSPSASSSSEDEVEFEAIEGDRNVRLAEAVVAPKGACAAR